MSPYQGLPSGEGFVHVVMEHDCKVASIQVVRRSTKTTIHANMWTLLPQKRHEQGGTRGRSFGRWFVRIYKLGGAKCLHDRLLQAAQAIACAVRVHVQADLRLEHLR